MRNGRRGFVRLLVLTEPFRIPHSALRIALLALPRCSATSLSNADQHAGRNERDEETGAAVGNEWQGDAGRREDRQVDADVQHGADADQGGQAGGEELAERVARRARNLESIPDKDSEADGQ